VYGVTPSFAAYLAASLAEQTAPIVVVTADDAGAQRLAADIGFFFASGQGSGADSGGRNGPVLHVPAIDTSPYAELSPDRRALMGRMAALYELARAGDQAPPPITALSATSLLRRVFPRDQLLARIATVRASEELDRDELLDTLARAGYVRSPVVEDPGSFAVRGGVVDLFPPMYRYPIRIELFGDDIETMRSFDPTTQRTLRDIDVVHIHPARETVATDGAEPRSRILEAADRAAHPSKQTRRILEAIEAGEEFVGLETLVPAFHDGLGAVTDYLPSNARWLLLDPDAIWRAVSDEHEVAQTRFEERVADHRLAFPPGDHYVGEQALRAFVDALEHRADVRALELHAPDGAERPALRFEVDNNLNLRSELERMRRQQATELIEPLARALGAWRQEGWRVGIACDSVRRADQLAGLVREYGIELARPDLLARPAPDNAGPEAAAGDSAPAARRESGLADGDGQPAGLDVLEAGGPAAIVRGRLSEGFTVPGERLVLVTDDDIFGARRRTSARQKRAARRAEQALLGNVGDFSELEVGNFLVHQVHGVGSYQGLTKLPGTPVDFLYLEYVGGKLFLPVYRLNEVQRYVGVEGKKPRLDKLGGTTWQKTRKKVSKDVKALAEDLLQLYAQRQALSGHAFPPADAMYQEFEATFEFEETPDQQKAIDAVGADMEKPRPMDRLVCGDVGYGKTEVALRAALKAVLGGKQVAVLAPTTVLVEQHYKTFARRMEGWPVTVERLSRFRARKEQLQTVRRLAEGEVDIVVGTHRLLSKDIRFKDLGLVVIDEEQRFGVTHKERLKKMRTRVDSLTLTATPIPRTLHMAMVGLRDLSIIATPPADRRAIRTFVSRPEDGVLREGIRRELSRGGQVFFVCPRIGPDADRGAGRRKKKRPVATTGGFHDGRRTMTEWAEHLAQLVPDARVAVAHGQLDGEELERIMVAFIDHEFDILVSTTIIENGIDIPRANTMFVDRADAFGISQLYQLRGRIGRSKERAFCYLLVPPTETLTDDAKRRLEALQRFSELGAGFQIASHDLEIRGAGDLLGSRQSGAISAVGFEQYTTILEEAVAELRGEEVSRAADPELNVESPGYIPDDYVPDTGQRLDLYKRLASAEDEDELSLISDEIVDRYGDAPLEVMQLVDLMVLKVYARRLGAVSVDLTAARVALAFGERTPLTAEHVVELTSDRKGPYRLTPDQRLQRQFSAEERDQPVASAKRSLLDLLAYVT